MPAAEWLNYFLPHPGNKTPPELRVAVGGISGAALSLSFTGFYLSIYSWICIGILMLMLFGASRRTAFLCGFFHALLFVFTSVPWIAEVLAVHGGLSKPGGWAILLLIASTWGMLIGAFGWAVNRLSRRGIGFACIGAPFVWVAMELVREVLPEISFPWNLLGYPASANLGLLQVVPITGIYGLSFVVAAFNALLAWTDAGAALGPKRRLGILAGATALLLALMLIGPRIVPEAPANHLARAAQLNFPELLSYPQDWWIQHRADLEEIGRISLQPQADNPDLLVWPETPAPFWNEDPQFAKLASSLAIHFGHPFIAGVIEWRPPVDDNERAAHPKPVPYNSAALYDRQGQMLFTYEKIHLVPFGEYEPFPLIHRVVNSVSDEVGGFHKGKDFGVGKLPGGYTFSVFICYEAVYPGEVRNFANKGADLLVNISNDGWFGRSAAPEQHLRMARVRAAENRRWLVRVTNNGYTVSVDPYGRIYRRLPPDIRAAADLPYDFRTDKTLYTRFGNWFAWLCVLVSVILVASTYRKAK
jgi:apolipoprotein N-acyltransferase